MTGTLNQSLSYNLNLSLRRNLRLNLGRNLSPTLRCNRGLHRGPNLSLSLDLRLSPSWRGVCPARAPSPSRERPPPSMTAALHVVACCGLSSPLRCGGSVPPRLPSLAGTGHPSQCRRLSVSSLGVVHQFGCPRGPRVAAVCSFAGFGTSELTAPE